MAQTNLCFACMNPIDAPEAVCPLCGHDNHIRDNGPGLLGHTLLQNQYLVGRVLGRGGFGVTYLGFDLNLERRVAIKEFFPSHLVMRTHDNQTLSALTGSETDYEHGRQRALKESQVAARMGQIYGVVQVYNVFSANNTVYIIMEYVEGDTLTQYIEKHPRMTVADAIEVLSPVARALSTLHQKSVIHRDVKPDNIMVHQSSQQGVLLDFGAARIADNTTISHSAAVVSQGYAPLEQYNMSSLDGRIDQYALAATLFHALSGQRPPDVLQRVAQGNAMPSLPALNPGVSAQTEAVVLKGMSIKAEDRYPDVAAFWDALKKSVTAQAAKPGFSVKKAVALSTAIALAAGVLGYYLPRSPLWQQLFAPRTEIVSTQGTGVSAAGNGAPVNSQPSPDDPAPTGEVPAATEEALPPVTATPTATATPEAPAETEAPTPTPTPSPTPGSTARPLPLPRISKSIKAHGVINAASQPLYKDSDTQSEVLLQLTRPGEVVHVIHFVINKQEEEWAKIICRGYTGYVPARFILLPQYKQQDDFQYITVGKHQALLSYTGSQTQLELPPTIDDLPLTTIASGAFIGTPVRELHLPASISWIDPDAFENPQQMLFHVEEGSAAQAYAQQRDIPCEVEKPQPSGDVSDVVPSGGTDDPATFYGDWIADDKTVIDLATGQPVSFQVEATVELSFRIDPDGNIYSDTLSPGMAFPWTFEGGIFRSTLLSCQALDADHLVMLVQSTGDQTIGLLCNRKSSNDTQTFSSAVARTDMAFYAGTWLMELSGSGLDLGFLNTSGSSASSYMQMELRADGTCTTTLMGIAIDSVWQLSGNQLIVNHEMANDCYLIIDDNTLELQTTYEASYPMPDIRLVRANPV